MRIDNVCVPLCVGVCVCKSVRKSVRVRVCVVGSVLLHSIIHAGFTHISITYSGHLEAAEQGVISRGCRAGGYIDVYPVNTLTYIHTHTGTQKEGMIEYHYCWHNNEHI